MSTEVPTPYEHGSDDLMLKKRKLIDQEIDILRHNQAGEILDFDTEIKLLDTAPAIAQNFAVKVFGLEQTEAYRAFYRAYVLGFQMVEYLFPDDYDVTIDLTAYWNEFTAEQDWQNKVINDTQTYLQHRIGLDDFINSYMCDMAKDNQHKAETEAICTMMFMLADRDIELKSKNT